MYTDSGGLWEEAVKGLKEGFLEKVHLNWILKDEYKLFKGGSGKEKKPSSQRGQPKQKPEPGMGWECWGSWYC